MGSLLFKTLIGALAGLVAWLVWEPSAPTPYTPQWESWELHLQLTAFFAIGLLVGAVNGWSKGSRVHALREGFLGGLFGVIGGSLGMAVGESLIKVYGHSPGGIGESVVISTVARVLALAPIATFLGAGIGASTLSLRGMFQGAIGGFIAGAVSGATFDVVGIAVGTLIVAANGAHGGQHVETGGPSRAMYFVLLGALVALFIGLAERVLRSAWVRLSLGRNEGKEWVVDRPQMLIGRSESAQIPLFGDPTVAPAHAYILHKGGAYVLADAGGSPNGVFLNGQRIGQAPLFHGAHIQVGSTVLEFLMRAGAAPQRGPEAYAPAYPVAGPGSVGYAQPPAAAPVGYNPGQPQPMPPQGYAPPQPMPTQAYQPPQPSMNPTVAAPGPLQPTQMAMPTAGPASRFALVALDGPLAGQKFPVGGPMELGRESAAVPMSYDTQASRRHATVTPGSFGVTITDSNSTNGTFVNGQRVTQAEVRAGDMVRVGQTTFRIESA
jgi:pSer/pThr/pTyr-binding forkhead associated (FHA) protein